MKVSIVIPIYNQLKMSIDCINDVLRTHSADLEVIAVDDGSKEPVTMALSRVFPQIKVLTNETNLGFAKTVNKGIQVATGDYICLLNNDIRLPNPSWLKLMLDSMTDLDMTAPAGGRMDSQWNYQPGEAKKRGEKFAYLVGWCLLVKREVFDQIGLIPEDFGRGFWEDVLFCHRAKKAGFKLDITEGTGVQHLYHQTFKKEGFNLAQEYQNKRKIFLQIVKRER